MTPKDLKVGSTYNFGNGWRKVVRISKSGPWFYIHYAYPVVTSRDTIEWHRQGILPVDRIHTNKTLFVNSHTWDSK
jgi:hypothetical protein